MGMFNSKSNVNVELRKVTDRRTKEQKHRHDRRVRPDRRLNNISVEWIPFTEVTFHPTIKDALCNHRTKNQANKTPIIEQSLLCIFRNNSGDTLDLRKVSDRRMQQQIRPYNRRVHPDRRLSNISVECIPYERLYP